MLSLETWGCFVPVYTTEVDVQLPKCRGTVLALRMYSRTVDSAYTELDGFPPPPPNTKSDDYFIRRLDNVVVFCHLFILSGESPNSSVL